MAILRLQLQVEIDTDSRQAHVVNQRVTDDLPGVCLKEGCGVRVPFGRKYCSRECFHMHTMKLGFPGRVRRKARMAHQTDAPAAVAPAFVLAAPPPSLGRRVYDWFMTL